MIRTRHTELRAEMVRAGLDGKGLAEKLGCASTTLSAKLCGKTPWNTDEMYYLMDLFDLPLNKLHIYFPRNGISDPRSYKPIMTLDTSNRYALAVANIMQNYGGGYKSAGRSVDDPLPTITAKDHNALVTAHIMTLRNNMDGQTMDEPLSTIATSGAHHAEVCAFLIKYFSNGAAKSVEDPLDTITTKDRFALITVNGEEYVITDIGMRMLQPHELFKAQGFPDDYIIDRDADGKMYPKSKQVARCGNAVTPPVPAALVRANLPEYCLINTSCALALKPKEEKNR